MTTESTKVNWNIDALDVTSETIKEKIIWQISRYLPVQSKPNNVNVNNFIVPILNLSKLF